MNQLIDVHVCLHLARTLLRRASRRHELGGLDVVDVVGAPVSTAVERTMFSARHAMAVGHGPTSSTGQVRMSTWKPAN